MARIVLATLGSLGDLHPFIAIGQALAARGDDVVLGVPADGLAKVRGAGLDGFALVPSYADFSARLGLTPEAVARRVIHDPEFVIDGLLMPSLAESTAALDAAAAGADVIAGSLFAPAAAIVAEKRAIPRACIVLQPMTLFSAWEPPVAPRFGAMRHPARGPMARSWNRMVYAVARRVLTRRHAARIDAVRASHGLAPHRAAPLFDDAAAADRTICCWSQSLGRLPPDAPANAVQTGFPFFDSHGGAPEMLAPDLAAFLAAGDAPIVFTLGSFVTAAPGEFYAHAATAARTLGRRAILLTGQPGATTRDGDILTLGYAPHSLLFPHAAAVVHHGGVGTTGQALRAGRPQLVVPHFGDQYDNAARVVRGGTGLAIRHRDATARTLRDALERLLASPHIAAAARDAAGVIANEPGADHAAAAIRRLVPDGTD